MRVAVVIAARDVAPYIGDAVASVLAQSHEALALIVVNDGSVDDTRRVVEGFQDSRLQLINEIGRGVSIARNCGAEVAQGADCPAVSGWR